MPACIEWGVERHQECTATADQGYNECTATRDAGYNACCTWWPCSWACAAVVWVSNVICVGWTWVSNVVCVAWTWISTAVCVVWDVLTTIYNAVIVVIELTLGWLFTLVAALVELVMAIPVLGTLIRWVLNAVTHVIGIIASIPDIIAGAIGIRPEKLLRVCTIIQLDEKGTIVAPVSDAVAMLQLACNVYKRDANVRIIPSRPFKFTSGFGGPETVDNSWVVTETTNSTTLTLDPGCDASGVGSEWLLGGSAFQLKITGNCLFGAWRRVLGYGAPIACIFVRNVTMTDGSNAVGCAFWITDFAVIERLSQATPRTLAHEVGHASNLWHVCVDDDNRNLMATQGACSPASVTLPNTANPRLSNFQVLAVRASKHCTYF